MTRVKTQDDIVSMREGGRMLATVLQLLRTEIRAGMSTKELAQMADTKLKQLGGKPAFLGYYGFPDVLCVSINDEVVHGIPREDRILQEGDVVGLDFGVLHKGLITDAAITVIVGKPRNRADADLVLNTEAAMYKGIDAVKEGIRVGVIGEAVEQLLGKSHYGIVRDFVGHGVGDKLHEEPNVPNFGPAHSGPILRSGMTIAIEPMATLGSEEVIVGSDNWTVKTRDGSRSAHFENTIVVTPDGAEILTAI